MHEKCTHTWWRLRRLCRNCGRGSAAYGHFVGAAPPRMLHIDTLELNGPASGIPGVTAIVGLWLR